MFYINVELETPILEINDRNIKEITQKYIKRVGNLTSNSIQILMSLNYPPADVLRVLYASFYYLGHKTKKDQENAWKQYKARRNFLQELMDFDYMKLTFKQCKKIQKMLEGISAESIKAKSAACTGLYNFIYYSVQLRIINAISQGECQVTEQQEEIKEDVKEEANEEERSPSPLRKEDEEEPARQPLDKGESTYSKGGKNDWTTLGKFRIIIIC